MSSATLPNVATRYCFCCAALISPFLVAWSSTFAYSLPNSAVVILPSSANLDSSVSCLPISPPMPAACVVTAPDCTRLVTFLYASPTLARSFKPSCAPFCSVPANTSADTPASAALGANSWIASINPPTSPTPFCAVDATSAIASSAVLPNVVMSGLIFASNSGPSTPNACPAAFACVATAASLSVGKFAPNDCLNLPSCSAASATFSPSPAWNALFAWSPNSFNASPLNPVLMAIDFIVLL